MTSHPEFNERTSALAVAEAFKDQITGKVGESSVSRLENLLCAGIDGVQSS